MVDNKLGDWDNDGKITIDDVLSVLKAALGIIKADEKQKIVADVDKDGVISLSDTLKILQVYCGIADGFDE